MDNVYFNIITDIFTILTLTVYIAYILRNSKKTYLLVYYTISHISAGISLAGNLFTGISPGGQLKGLFLAIMYTSGSCFAVFFFYFVHFHVTKRHFAGPSYFIRPSPGRRKKSDIPAAFILPAVLSVFAVYLINSAYLLLPGINAQAVLLLAVFTVSFICIMRFDLFDTMPLGIRRSLGMFNDALLVFDDTGELLYGNKAFQVLDEKAQSLVSNECRKGITAISIAQEKTYRRQIETADGLQILAISLQPVFSIFKRIKGYVCVINNDTAIISGIRELEEKNGQLELMNENIRQYARETERLGALEERNILAKEIHDILGHSLNLALRTFESNKIIADDQPQKVLQRLKQVIGDIDRGMSEIKTGSLKLENAGRVNKDNFLLFRERLTIMAERLREIGVVVEITALDDISSCSDETIKTIFRICQETTTNSIKHGKATRVTMSIKLRDNWLIMRIIDNGLGCKAFVKGNGLSGMEDRVESLGGSIGFCPFDDNKGFLVHAKIPVT